MIANHSRVSRISSNHTPCPLSALFQCVVQSYLQWLQDSDYEPVCILCNHSLDEGDVVRLCCHGNLLKGGTMFYLRQQTSQTGLYINH